MAGTGSVCFGKNDRGITARAGSWGHIMGNEGKWLLHRSGSALTAVVKSFDGRQRPTALSAMVLEHLKLPDEQQLVVQYTGAVQEEGNCSPCTDRRCSLRTRG